MNKKLIITTIFLIYCSLVLSQVNDTIYYDIYWKNTSKEKAEFFRPYPLKKEQDLYIVKDYFIDGTLQMKGHSNDKEGELFEGKVVWYYENGNIETERTYSNGIIEGEVNSYFMDGTLLSSGIYKNNEAYSGNIYLETITHKFFTYVNGVIVSESTYYEDTKTIAQKIYYESGSSKGKTVFFNKKGDIIATKYVDESENKTGIKILKVFSKLTSYSDFKDIFFVLYEVENNDKVQHIIKDENQKIIAQGFLKNRKPHTGIFFEDYQLIEYKEGIKDGKVVFYTKEYQKTAIGVYKNGEKFSGEFYDYRDAEKEVFKNGKIIAKRTKNIPTGEEYYCEFEGNTPTNGDYFTYRKLETFKNKKLIKTVDIDDYTGLKKKTTFYGKDKYETIKEIYHKGKEEYITIYKDGMPFEGREGSKKGYITYTNGEITGPFLREEYRQATITGNYKNYKKEGNISYVPYNRKDTVSCLFKEDKPITGTIFENSQLTNYKNGKKDGCGYKIFDYKGYVYDSIQMCYIEGLPSGTKKYFKENKFVTQLTYKDGKPFNGTSYIEKYKTVYKDGKKVENEMPFSKNIYKQQFFNIDNQPTKEVIKKDNYTDSMLYTVSYKKGIPFQGVQIAYDSVNDIYIKTNYIKGKKEGTQNIYTYLDRDFIAQYNYKNNIKEGLARFKINPYTDTIYEISYKKGKPYTGTLIENESDNKNNYKKTYNKGKIQSITYYQYSKDNELASISFKNGKPYDGYILEDNEYDKDVKEYSDGKLVSTYIGVDHFSNFKPKDYDTKVYHKSLKDSIVNKYKYNFNIIYNSKTKKSGEVYYYLDSIQKGYGKFKGNKLIEFNHYKDYEENYKITINLLNDSLVYEITLRDYREKFKIKVDAIEKPHYKFFIEKAERDLKLTDKMELFIDNSNTPLSTIDLKNGKPYNGIIFSPLGNSLFEINVYKKGEVVKEYKQLTKQELIDTIGSVQ